MGAIDDLVYGESRNGIPFARFGSGPKKMLICAGGPGNIIPKGMELKFMIKPFLRFAGDYTVYYVTRRMNMPEGHSTRDMSDDYADMIGEDLGGNADVVIGISYGGLIAQHFAADHADLCEHIIIVVAAHTVSERGKQIDYDFARYASEGKKRKAAAIVSEALAEGAFMRIIMKAFSGVVGGLMFKNEHPGFKQDLMVEAEAEVAHDTLDRLKDIQVPVLLICGDRDVYFSIQSLKMTAEAIKHAQLVVYEGKGHAGVLQDKRLPEDIARFIGSG